MDTLCNKKLGMALISGGGGKQGFGTGRVEREKRKGRKEGEK